MVPSGPILGRAVVSSSLGQLGSEEILTEIPAKCHHWDPPPPFRRLPSPPPWQHAEGWASAALVAAFCSSPAPHLACLEAQEWGLVLEHAWLSKCMETGPQILREPDLWDYFRDDLNRRLKWGGFCNVWTSLVSMVRPPFVGSRGKLWWKEGAQQCWQEQQGPRSSPWHLKWKVEALGRCCHSE